MVDQQTNNIAKKALTLRWRFQRTKNNADLRQERIQYLERQQDLSGQTTGHEIEILEGLFFKNTELQSLEFGIPICGWENTRHAHLVNSQSQQQHTHC
jgi:hypothetical protein